MHGFSEHQLLFTFLAIAILLGVARGMAELARRLGQPEVLGELLGGFLIGPSVLGALLPGTYAALYLEPVVGHALQLISWIGAILLLMIAGMEADLAILREKSVPGLLAAAGAVGAALGVGTWLGVHYFGRDRSGAFFLGLVLSVTAVSVVAKLLIEREALRRDYAQVMLAAGIASEVLVWPLISVVSSVQHRDNPFVAGLRATLLAAAFFAFMLTLGRRFTFWAMRRVADVTDIVNGELSLVLILLFLAAAATTVMGLHPLLGAFVFGVLLSKAPRATVELKQRIQSITIALFAPVFFGLAGMRVNLFDLRGSQYIQGILLLFLAAGAIKVLLGFAGALAGRLPVWEAATVGVGLNLKGGTDVVVAIVGTELLLLSPSLYTMYAVVAILTVLASPPLMAFLAEKTRPGEQEMKRLNREEAKRMAYLSGMERILVPLVPELLPAATASLVSALAAGKQGEAELFDITECSTADDTSLTRSDTHSSVIDAASSLATAAEQSNVELRHVSLDAEEEFTSIQEAADGQQLLAIGTTSVTGELALSFGPLQDRLLRELEVDVLMAVAPQRDLPPVKRILVPVNGLGHAMSAADVAGYLAKGWNAEVVLFSVVAPRLGPLFWRERMHRDLLRTGYSTTREAQERIARLEVQQSEQVALATDAAEAVLAELRRQPYQLLVMGSVMRSSDHGISLGGVVERLLQTAPVPRVVLISRAPENAAAATG